MGQCGVVAAMQTAILVRWSIQVVRMAYGSCQEKIRYGWLCNVLERVIYILPLLADPS